MNTLKSQITATQTELRPLLEIPINKRSNDVIARISELQTRIRNLNTQIGLKK